MKEELNTISEEELNEAGRINTKPDDKNYGGEAGGGKPGPIKDTVGFWTDRQIAENPEAYIKYLEELLNNKFRADEIKDIISEMSRIKKEYLSNEYSEGRIR